MVTIRVPLSYFVVVLIFVSLESRATVASPLRRGAENGSVGDATPSIVQHRSPAAGDNGRCSDRESDMGSSDDATGRGPSAEGPGQLIINPFVEQPDLRNSPPGDTKPPSGDPGPVEPRMIINPHCINEDKLAGR